MTLLNLGTWEDDRFERMIKAGWQDPGGPRRWRVEPRTCPVERSRAKTARQEHDTPAGTIQRGDLKEPARRPSDVKTRGLNSS